MSAVALCRSADRNNFVAASLDQPLQSPATFQMIFGE
jgi:hypothetical protein